MILKSMSRKGSASVHFPQLFDYISKDARPEHQLWHNFMHYEPSRGTTIKGFIDNARDIKQDSRHNVLYHEVMSLSRQQGSEISRQIAALRQLAKTYLEQRAPNQLAYGGIHLDKDHSVHLHLMISSNEMGSKKRVRLPKAEFSNIQREIENILHRDYPELEQKRIYTREKPFQREQGKTSDKEQNLKRRTQAPSKKDRLRDTLKKVFSSAHSREEAKQQLEQQGIELIERGKTITAVQGKFRCRLKRLGIEKDYQEIGMNQSQSQEDPRFDFLRKKRNHRQDQNQGRSR